MMMCVLVSKAHYNQYFNAESISKPNETPQRDKADVSLPAALLSHLKTCVPFHYYMNSRSEDASKHLYIPYMYMLSHCTLFICKDRCSISQNIRQVTIIAMSDDSSHILHRSKMKFLIGKLVCVLNKISYLMYIELHESNSFVLEVLKAHQVSTEQDIKGLKR